MNNSNIPRVLSASSIMRKEVVNLAGEQLGTIKELMIDLDEGHIAYAVLSYGGFLGLGEKLFAIPWDALTVDPDYPSLILEVDKETLEEAPGFDENNWPHNTKYEAGWLFGIYDYYGSSPLLDA